MSSQDRKVWQPLHPEVRGELDPEYVAFHDEYMQYVQPDDQKIWDGTARTEPSLPPGGLPPLAVGSTKEFTVGKFQLRAYIPTGDSDETEWPVFVWFHGGGWAIGGLDDNKDFVTFVCQEAKCVVITVDYRLAPENPFPAAVEDAVDAVRWVAANPPELGGVDVSRISVGGTSAGATLAIVASLAVIRASIQLPSATPSLKNTVPFPLVSLLLIVPVIDNTATPEGIWERNAPTAPWLTPARMEWYRKLYFTEPKDRSQWDASPNFAPSVLLSQLPSTWMAISEQDILAPEADKFGAQLKELGVEVESITIEGGTHSILSLAGKIARGRKMVEDAAEHLKKVFHR